MSRTCALLLGAACMFALLGCSQIPRVDVTPAVEDSRVVFDIPYSGVRGILEFRVEDEARKPLWVIKTSYEKGRRITYGILPAGGNMEARQEYPPENRPPADIRGKTIVVSVTYQYDSYMAACSGIYTKTVKVPE